MPDGNSTFLSRDQDKDSSKYRASFELYPHTETHEFALFRGQLTGQYARKGVRHDEFCSVRTMTNSHPKFRDWESFMERSGQAQLLAKQFNNIVMQRQCVSFTNPVRAEMDTTWNKKSLLGRLISVWKPHRKFLNEGEVVVLEEVLGRYTSTYIHDTGFVGPRECDVLQAFGHFTWFFTSGRLVICGLKGKRQSNGQFLLNDPTVHSGTQAVDNKDSIKDIKFGPRDMQDAGISSFFKFHRCNDICRDMAVPT